MVKYAITAEEYEALSAELKAEYKSSGDGYKLDVTGIDVKAQDKVDGERDKRRAAEKRATDAEKALEDFKDGDDRPAIVAKAAKDVEKANKKAEDADNKYRDKVQKDTLGGTAQTLADTLSKVNAKVLLPHINARLSVDMTDPDAPKVIVLDAAGKPTDKTVEDLRTEFVANKDFAGIITSSQATGGAASKSVGNGRSGNPSVPVTPANQGATPPNLGALHPRDLAAQITARRAARGLEVAE